MSYEKLSALLDGECSAEELDRLLADLDQSPDLKAQWSRMCLAREGVEGTRIRKAQPCIVAGVMAGLDKIPVELAKPNVVELRRPRSMIVKQVAGWAVAASVATVAMLVGVNTGGHQEPAVDFTASTAQQTTLPVTEPVSYPVVPRQARNLQSVSLRMPAEQQWQDAGEDLDNYLIEHNTSLANQGMGMGGTLRAARFAAHSATYHPEGQP
ncbi:MAG: sigma-E factor negative regulatory protein [Pseudomonadota bacterium]